MRQYLSPRKKKNIFLNSGNTSNKSLQSMFCRKKTKVFLSHHNINSRKTCNRKWDNNSPQHKLSVMQWRTPSPIRNRSTKHAIKFITKHNNRKATANNPIFSAAEHSFLLGEYLLRYRTHLPQPIIAWWSPLLMLWWLLVFSISPPCRLAKSGRFSSEWMNFLVPFFGLLWSRSQVLKSGWPRQSTGDAP